MSEEPLDPRNVNVLAQHAVLYMALRRLPKTLRKIDQILDITSDNVRTLAAKRLSHKAKATCHGPRQYSLRSNLPMIRDRNGVQGKYVATGYPLSTV